MNLYKKDFSYIRTMPKDMHCLDIPIECIRMIRSLNVDRQTRAVSREVYKILNSSNGKKLFALNHGIL